MSPDAPSLVLGNGAQLQLLDVDDAGLPARAYEIAEEAGRFTGERIFSGNPKLYNAMVRLLGRGVPYREIADICSVSVNTVCAVCQREGMPIETIRERVGRLALDVAALTIEAIRDLLADPDSRARLTVKDLAICFGITTQNAQLLLGGVTARIGTEHALPSHDDYLRFVKDVTPTSLTGESPAQIAAPAEPAALEASNPSS